MSRITAVDPNAASKAKELLDAVKAQLGRVPNMMKVMAQSPAALGGMLSLSSALAGGTLKPELREQIAIAVSQANSCEYCLSAHTAMGKLRGLPPEELAAARNGDSADPKAQAALQFALAIVAERGRVTDGAFTDIREAGYSDEEIAEIVANVALMIFTNYFNNVAQTKLDWPLVSLEK
ncbi:carboxymuconolactone decarboxylase family protein [uncultured Paludibaculum sp.]|uniref:carboxymuconolactone decarboxylase family protein n=1 Tax=uncultured Paludibaculum sp. TaxID=1765020 RepID=UPI002AABEBB5|nr:carboxymuconolactone decarboxylase family protein [uncultured Paludibaculum sp.]